MKGQCCLLKAVVATPFKTDPVKTDFLQMQLITGLICYWHYTSFCVDQTSSSVDS